MGRKGIHGGGAEQGEEECAVWGKERGGGGETARVQTLLRSSGAPAHYRGQRGVCSTRSARCLRSLGAR